LKRLSRLQAGFAVGRAVTAAHPRHLVLLGLAAGLLLGPLSAPAVLGAAAVALLAAGRIGVGLVAATAVLGGAVLAEARLAARDHGPLAGREGAALDSRAVVLEPVRERPDGRRTARVGLLDGAAAGADAALRIDAEAGWPVRADVGAIVRVRGTVDRLRAFEAHQRRRGAQAAIDVAWVRSSGGRRGGPAGDLDAVRRRAERALGTGVPPPQAALLRGMVLGQDDAIEEPVREEFRRSGLSHLLAASGQNVMLLAILAIAAAGALGAGLRVRLLVAMALIALYIPLAGGGPSIQRAGVMGVAGLVAALAGRPASRWYAVLLAAAATLAVNPRASGEPGWQLSFAAVIALLALSPALRGWLGDRGWPPPLADATAITLAATAGTAPLMALHFDAISLASLPANLLVAPAVAPVMWLGMLAAGVGQMSVALAAPLAGLAAYPVAYVEWVAHVSAGLPAASVAVRLPGPVATAAVYAALGAVVLAAASLWRRLGRRPRAERRWLGLAALVVVVMGVAALGSARPPARAPGELVVSFLDVGQGDATLLQLDATAVLFDTGPPRGPVLERLRESGVDRLDALVVTHQSADHDGMTGAVIRAHRPRTVVNGGAGYATTVQRALSGQASRVGARVLVPEAGQTLAFGQLEIRVLWPPPELAGAPPGEGDANDRAMVAHVSLGTFDLLLPADAESNVTGGLDLPDVEALKVAHHGSEDEGLGAQLSRIRPEFAAVEVGAGNSYGHPRASTLAALKAVPTVMRTDRDGTIRLRVADGRMRVE